MTDQSSGQQTQQAQQPQQPAQQPPLSTVRLLLA